jgi:hypothetical protein
MKRGRVISFDSPEKKAVSVFHTTAKVRGIRSDTHQLADQSFKFTVEGD